MFVSANRCFIKEIVPLSTIFLGYPHSHSYASIQRKQSSWQTLPNEITVTFAVNELFKNKQINQEYINQTILKTVEKRTPSEFYTIDSTKIVKSPVVHKRPDSSDMAAAAVYYGRLIESCKKKSDVCSIRFPEGREPKLIREKAPKTHGSFNWYEDSE